jgi:small subunit ribosomal protein S4e
MAKRHMKTLTAPVTWPIKRKTSKFVIRSNPGKLFKYSLPLAIVFKHLLKYCKTHKEVKAILQDNEVLVNGQRRKDPKYPLGLLDVLSFSKTKEHFRLLLGTNKKMYLVTLSPDQAKYRIVKILGKHIIGKDKIQLNLFDSTNMLVKDNTHKVGDSLIIDFKNKIQKHLAMEKGAYVFLIAGKHIGEHGQVLEINKNMIKIKTEDSEFETPKEGLIIIGKTKPEINLK